MSEVIPVMNEGNSQLPH